MSSRALGLLHAQLAVALGADERVEGEHAHAEAPRALGDELADAPEAEDPERLLVELDAGELRALPACRRSATCRPAGCCARARAAAPSCARRRSRRWTRARWRRRSRASWRPRTSTLSTPTPARPITLRWSARSISSAVSFVAERMRMPSYSPMRSRELLARPSRPRGRRRSARAAGSTPESPIFSLTRTRGRARPVGCVGGRGAHREILSTTQSMQAVSACTSAVSTAGNIPMRSWLRPSLR